MCASAGLSVGAWGACIIGRALHWWARGLGHAWFWATLTDHDGYCLPLQLGAGLIYYSAEEEAGDGELVLWFSREWEKVFYWDEGSLQNMEKGLGGGGSISWEGRWDDYYVEKAFVMGTEVLSKCIIQGLCGWMCVLRVVWSGFEE